MGKREPDKISRHNNAVQLQQPVVCIKLSHPPSLFFNRPPGPWQGPAATGIKSRNVEHQTLCLMVVKAMAIIMWSVNYMLSLPDTHRIIIMPGLVFVSYVGQKIFTDTEKYLPIFLCSSRSYWAGDRVIKYYYQHHPSLLPPTRHLARCDVCCFSGPNKQRDKAKKKNMGKQRP